MVDNCRGPLQLTLVAARGTAGRGIAGSLKSKGYFSTRGRVRRKPAR